MWITRHAAARQFARYAVVGGINTLVSFVSFGGLIAAGVPYVVASGVAFLPAAATSYLGNRLWTFAETTVSHVGAAPRYVVVLLLGLMTDLVLIAALVDGIGLPKLAAQLAVTPVVAIQGYLLSRGWAFATRTTPAPVRIGRMSPCPESSGISPPAPAESP